MATKFESLYPMFKKISGAISGQSGQNWENG